MRHFVDRYHYVAVIAALSMLPACGKLTPAGADETMTLLRAGSQRICIAPEVQTTLRNLIVTKAADLPDRNVPLEQRTQAVAAVHLSYDMTTLESFDAAVSRATCNTTVKIGSVNGDSKSSFRVIFAVSSAAEDANSFVVTANVDEPHAFATSLIGDEINDIAAKAYVQQQDRDNAQRQQQLLALVNDKWLRGAWIDANAAAENCGNGQAVWFEPGHVFEGVMGKGRWSLNRDQLHIVVGGGFDKTGTINAADPISFHVDWGDENSFSLRRCTKAEIETLPQADSGEVVQ